MFIERFKFVLKSSDMYWEDQMCIERFRFVLNDPDLY